MKKPVYILTIVLLATICLANPVRRKNNNPVQKGNLRVLSLEGTPYDRGIEHGKTLKKDIHELVRL